MGVITEISMTPNVRRFRPYRKGVLGCPARHSEVLLHFLHTRSPDQSLTNTVRHFKHFRFCALPFTRGR